MGTENDETLVITHITEEDKVTFKKLNKDEMIDWIYSQVAPMKQISEDKNAAETKAKESLDDLGELETKHSKLLDQIAFVESKLHEEKEPSSDLMSKLDKATGSGDTGNESTSRPSILLITDACGEEVFNQIECSEVNWNILLVEKLSQLPGIITNKIKEIANHDKVVIMLGRMDILAGGEDGEAHRILATLTNVVKMLDANEIPVMISQILPIKTRQYRSNVTIFNRKIADSTTKWEYIDTQKVFDILTVENIFVRAKITIIPTLLKEVANELAVQTGVPEKRTPIDHGDDDDDDNDDDEDITEFIEYPPGSKRVVVGLAGVNIQDTQKMSDTTMNCIEFYIKENKKHGVLITGDRSNILKAKIAVADQLANTKRNDIPPQKGKPPKRGASSKPWVGKLSKLGKFTGK